MNDFKNMLDKLARDGGCIVSSGDCSALEIADAQARGDWAVDLEGFGFVLRPHAWLQKHSRFARHGVGSCEQKAQEST